jgi:uncharacterized membrane protein YeaQ/YmgE (transglycosylase-associated protein family)
MGILVTLVVGVLAGWLAGLAVRGAGFGIVGDLVIGVVGAFIGNWLLLIQLHVRLGSGFVGALISAAIGAIILLVVIKLIRGAVRRV